MKLLAKAPARVWTSATTADIRPIHGASDMLRGSAGRRSSEREQIAELTGAVVMGDVRNDVALVSDDTPCTRPRRWRQPTTATACDTLAGITAIRSTPVDSNRRLLGAELVPEGRSVECEWVRAGGHQR